MPTIKDVARLAGVSHGSVSNVINGTKTVNSEIVERVQKAIKELGYQTNAKARSLRINKTNLIGVVLPNISDTVYGNMYEGISYAFRDTGYSTQLWLTEDKSEREQKALQSLQEQRVEGILLTSCMPGERAIFDPILASGTFLVFLRRDPHVDGPKYSVMMEEDRVLTSVMQSILNEGSRSFLLLTDKLSYSNEEEIAIAFGLFLKNNKETGISGTTCSCSFGANDAFRACINQLICEDVPDVILTTDSRLTEIAQKAVALYFNALRRQPKVVCVHDYCASSNYASCDSIFFNSGFYYLGKRAGEKLVGLLSGQTFSENVNEILYFADKKPNYQVQPCKSPHPLRICLMEGIAADAMQLMAHRFTTLTGKSVEIEVFSYEEMNQRMTMLDIVRDFDIVQTNRPWLSDCAESGFILQLDNHISVADLDYPEEILNTYSFVDGKLFGIPYMMGAQLLFYRKDIFRDLRYKRLYYEQYQCELRPPQTWQEFDRIASFFTRSINPISPVEYGTAFAAASTYSVYSYIPRLWEKRGAIFDESGNVALKFSVAALSALGELKEALSFCSPNSMRKGWSGQIKSFLNGDVAMINVYESHFMDSHQYADSSIVGKLDVALMPGAASIRGGWVLTVSGRTHQVDDTMNFLRWFSSNDSITLYNILGGSNPGNAMLNSRELNAQYPWFALACKSLSNAKPMLQEGAPIQQATFERIAGSQIESYLLGNSSAELAIENIADQISKIGLKARR